MNFNKYLTNVSANKLITSLLVIFSILISGCGAGGGAADNKTGVLAPSSIAISPSAPSSVAIGLTTNFTAQATYADGSKADITTQVSWATGDTTVATIDSTGKATGHKTGSSTTVTATLSGISATPVTLNVNSKVISSIIISTVTASVPKGGTTDFIATASYSDGSSGSVTGSVTWSSSNTPVAILNSSGTASTLAVGTANISASVTVGSTVVTSNSVQLSVSAPVLVSITISPSSANIAVGSTKQFTANGVLTDGTPATLGTLTWLSSSPAAIISSTGLATGVSAGSSNISATSGSISSSIATLTVNKILMGGSMQGAPLNLTAQVTSFAGSGVQGAFDAAGTAATFNTPLGITTDGTNLYVTDSFSQKIRKITVVGQVVSTLAGSGAQGAVDATGTAASFYNPTGITTDGSNLYVADTYNHKIRKIVIATGVVTTFAGSGVAGAYDATGTSATFQYPFGITTDGSNLYIADYSNNKIRKIEIATGIVSTLAGSGVAGSNDAIGASASFNGPHGITTDGSNLYITDFNNHKIRKIMIATGAVTTLAGAGVIGSIDATGLAASFNTPTDLTSDGKNLFVADLANHKIRKIVIDSGVVTTLAGTGAIGALDAAGTSASFNFPSSITTDGSSLYVVDRSNHKIRKIQ